MCGIAGIVASSPQPIDRDVLSGMAAMLDHRGPDESAVHIEPGVGLAHTRLSILDLQRGGQPMASEDGSLWITFNGEIFNHVELRRDLERKGHRFRTTSDTEVLLRLFETEGERALQKLNGQWAFAIWNRRTRELFASRDRLGVRPLFYTLCGGRLLFASEIKALFADPAVPRALNPRSLDEIFTFWTTLPETTPFADIHALAPGHSLTWRDRRLDIRQYWAPSFPADGDGHTATDANETQSMASVRAALEEATRIRLRSDVPVGAYLSGGLDSSMIVALMKQAGIERPRTFAIAFEEPEFDESLHQRQAARALQTDHHELRCSADDIARVFPEVVWHAETPLLRTAPAPLFLLSRLARERGCKVVLTGEGADEMFGGYDIFKEAKVRRFCAQHPESVRRAALVRRLYPYLPDLQRQPQFARSFFNDNAADLHDPCFSHRPRWRTTARMKMFFSDRMRESLGDYNGTRALEAMLPDEHASWHPLSQAQYLEMTHLLPGYLLSSQGDRMAMAHGVESRYPFLDRDVVALASGLPPNLKMKVLNEKYLLKRIARDLIPTAVWRRHKQPYRAPGARLFFAASNRAYVEQLLSPDQIQHDGVFHPERVSRLVQKLRAGKAFGAGDDAALAGILSTQILIDRFINHFSVVPHGLVHYSGAAEIHRG